MTHVTALSDSTGHRGRSDAVGKPVMRRNKSWRVMMITSCRVTLVTELVTD